MSPNSLLSMHNIQCHNEPSPTAGVPFFPATNPPILTILFFFEPLSCSEGESDENIKLGKYKDEDYWLRNKNTQYNTILFTESMSLSQTIQENML